MEIIVSSNAYFNSEVLGVGDEFVMIWQDFSRRHPHFPREVIVTMHEVTIVRRGQRTVFRAAECRWWRGSLATDSDLQKMLVFRLPALVLECHLQSFESEMVAIAIGDRAAIAC